MLSLPGTLAFLCCYFFMPFWLFGWRGLAAVVAVHVPFAALGAFIDWRKSQRTPRERRLAGRRLERRLRNLGLGHRPQREQDAHHTRGEHQVREEEAQPISLTA